MIRNLRFRYSNSRIVHDDTVSETTIRSNVANFFRTKFGSRETYTIYRGCIIVRTTRQFTGCRPERVTIVYLYSPDLEGSPNTLHLCEAKSVRHAQRVIDSVLQAEDMRVVDKDGTVVDTNAINSNME